MKQSGAALGYGKYADAITKTSSGQYVGHDPAMRNEIFALRKDPTANSMMAGAFANSNAKVLTDRLGRKPTDGELYMAHFLGASGASRFISAAEANPNAKAAALFPRAAHANSSIFYDKVGQARSLKQVYAGLVSRHNVTGSHADRGGEACRCGEVCEPGGAAAACAAAAAGTPAANGQRRIDRVKPTTASSAADVTPPRAASMRWRPIRSARTFAARIAMVSE